MEQVQHPDAVAPAFVSRHAVTVARYVAAEHATVWADAVARARTSIFLFDRAYMDYHADRFVDHSLIVHSDGELLGVFPASASGTMITSHAGLTFGGLVCGADVRQTAIAEAWRAIANYYATAGFATLIVKQVPAIFRRPISDDESWAFWMLGAHPTRIDVNSVIDRRNAPPLKERRVRSIKKATKRGVTVVETNDFTEYWNDVLTPVLMAQHGERPVHSLDEIHLLRARLPTRIRLFCAQLDGKTVAGTVVYDYGVVLHTQYLAAAEAGRDVGALDFLMHHLITVTMPPTDAQYLSFGIANDQQGRELNVGLIDWKEGFGAHAIPHYFWSLSLG